MSTRAWHASSRKLPALLHGSVTDCSLLPCSHSPDPSALRFILLCIFQNIPGLPDSADPHHFEDSLDALHRMGANYKIMIATVGNVFSIRYARAGQCSACERIERGCAREEPRRSAMGACALQGERRGLDADNH